MPVIRVAELTDPRLDPYRSLKTTNHTRDARLFVAEGEKLVERLLASRFAVDSVLVNPSHVDRIEPLVPAEVPIYLVSAAELETLIGFNFHRGVLACGRRQPGPTLEDILDPPRERLTLVVCPDVKDPENLGSIIRTSSAFGVDALILGTACGDPFSRRILRVSMGSILRLPCLQTDDIPKCLQALREAGIELTATVLDPAAEPLSEFRRGPRTAILFGSEGHGLSGDVVALCQRRLTIAMNPGIDSLNVAVAAGIFLQHLTRQ